MTDRVRVVFAEMLSRGPECWPFDAQPQWLLDAIDKYVRLTTRGARDYAVMEVETPRGVVEAGPGDFIVRNDSGHLSVETS